MVLKNWLPACFLLAISGSVSQAVADETVGVTAMGWLQGEWIGEGREGDNGPVEGKARLYWTPPLDGVMTYLFTWNKPEDGHVHHALTVFDETEEGVYGKGIHYGRDFANFEERPWKLKLKSADQDAVVFDCYEDCRAQTLSFSIRDDGALIERWSFDDGDMSDWVVTYHRAE